MPWVRMCLLVLWGRDGGVGVGWSCFFYLHLSLLLIHCGVVDNAQHASYCMRRTRAHVCAAGWEENHKT